eukprot:6174800-Pleurochrysis_carterae.AAC.2
MNGHPPTSTAQQHAEVLRRCTPKHDANKTVAARKRRRSEGGRGRSVFLPGVHSCRACVLALQRS